MERSPENNVSVFKIICTYFISLFLFVVVQSVSCVVLTLIVSLLASIPVIGSIVAFIFFIRKDGLAGFSIFASYIIALFVADCFVVRFNKENKIHHQKVRFALSITFLIIGILSLIGSFIDGLSIIDGLCFLIISYYESHIG